jgi:hypothetical protein
MAPRMVTILARTIAALIERYQQEQKAQKQRSASICYVLQDKIPVFIASQLFRTKRLALSDATQEKNRRDADKAPY